MNFTVPSYPLRLLFTGVSSSLTMAVYRTAAEQLTVFLTTVGLIFLVIGLCYMYRENLNYGVVRLEIDLGAIKLENKIVTPVELHEGFESRKFTRPALVEIPPGPNELPYRTLYDVVDKWNPDSVDIPADFKETIQHFDYSDPRERQIAERYRDAEVPFKLYNVPEFNNVTTLWSDEYLTENFKTKARYHVERSKDNHFMFWSNKGGGGKGYKPPTDIVSGMNFPTWRQMAKEADEKKISNDSVHYYFVAGADAHENGRTFISRDLPLLSTKTNNFFITKVSSNKGIQCRFGMRGVIAESHYDSGRNMIVMLRGTKRYIINPPRACPKLAIISEKRHPSFRHSVIDWSDINQARSHEFDKVEAIDTIVHQGEILYVPSFWFHYIISLEYSIQCNSRSGFPESMFGKTDIEKCYGYAMK